MEKAELDCVNATFLKNKPGLEAGFTKLRWIGSTDSPRQVCVARATRR